MVEGIVMVEGVVVLLLAVMVVSLLRGYAAILDELTEIRMGSGARDEQTIDISERTSPLLDGAGDAADVLGTEPSGDAVKVAVSGQRGGKTLLAFLSTGCLACQEFWIALGDPRRTRRLGDTRIVIVTKDDREESPSAIAEMAPDRIQTVMSSQAWDDYGIKGSPFFVYIDSAGGEILGAGTARSWDQALDLLLRSRSDADALRSDTPPQDDEARTAAELAAAGIGPGDPSAHPHTTSDLSGR